GASAGGHGDVRSAGAHERGRRASRREGRPPRPASGLRGGDPNGRGAARAGPGRALVARARECDRALDAHRGGSAAAGRSGRLRHLARRPALSEGQDALTRLAFSNLAAPAWTLERTLDAVGEYGYDGLELRLLDGEPIDPLSVDAGTRRAVGAALARAEVPLVR